MKLKYYILLGITTSLLLTACNKYNQEFSDKKQASYYQNLLTLCGKTFVGKSSYPLDPEHDFAGKKLVAHFKSCTDTEIRIPFTVGENKSRTWIISNTNKGLLLKHDHRHKDGTPDEITMYGGYAGSYKNSSGSQYHQHFLADSHTAELIPAASSNVWTLNFDPKSKQLTYNLERHQKPRYEAILQLQPE